MLDIYTPDPFPRERVGSADETSILSVCSTPFCSLEPDPPTSAALDVIKITSTRKGSAGDLNYIQRCGSRRVWFETSHFVT